MRKNKLAEPDDPGFGTPSIGWHTRKEALYAASPEDAGSRGPGRILRLPEILQRTGLSRSTIYAAIRKGVFPKQIRLTARCVGWSENLIADWISARLIAEQLEAENE